MTRGQRQLRVQLGEAFTIRIHCAVQLPDSQPEPDLAVALGPDERYDGHHPVPAELLLVIEVADSSVENDRDVKGPMYAAAGIRTYWIVNLVANRIEVYTDPTGSAPNPGYRSRRDYLLDETIPLPGFEPAPATIAVRDLLPKTA